MPKPTPMTLFSAAHLERIAKVERDHARFDDRSNKTSQKRQRDYYSDSEQRPSRSSKRHQGSITRMDVEVEAKARSSDAGKPRRITGRITKEPSTDEPYVVMPVKTHTWISLWFLITAPVIIWDASFNFARPRSFEGGDLHHFWSPYKIYQNVDLVYGVEAYKRGDGFPNAQSFLNVIETIMNVAYLYYAHVAEWPPATVIGFAAATMTLSKTVLYWAQEYYCNYCAIGHNTLYDLIVFWIIPNGFWIVIPSMIVYRLGKDLGEASSIAAKVQSGKTK